MLRRVKNEDGERDETFGTDLGMGPQPAAVTPTSEVTSPTQMIPIAAQEADRIVARIRRDVTGGT